MDLLRLLMRPHPAGRLFGIPILIVPAVLLLTLLLLLSAGQRAGEAGFWWTFTTLVVLMVALLAHELGHALVARRLGVRVIDITIWPLGGMARLQDMTEKPWVEGPIALAGPAVNFALAGLSWPFSGLVAEQALWVNLVLAVGNLVPAFPLDGGRVLRSWLARGSPLVDATRASCSVASLLSLGLLIAGFAYDAAFIGILLAGYIWISGKRELVSVVLRFGTMPSLPVGEVFRRAFRPPAGPTGPAEAPEAQNDDREDLERFHGSLDEFFGDRRRPR